MLWAAMNVVDSAGPVAQRPQVWMIYPLDLSPGRRWIVAAWAAIGLLGVFAQLRFTARSKAVVRVKAKKSSQV